MRSSVCILLIFLFQSSKAQTWEIGLNLGALNYWGDLAPSTAFNEFNPSASVFLKKNLNGYFSVGGSLLAGTITGDDQNFKSNQLRNLSFKTNLVELSTFFEFNFNKYIIGQRAKRFSPYTFGGIGVAYFQPMAEYDGTWYKLRNLSTEGQKLEGGGSNYQPITIVLPFGVGVKWAPGKKINTSLHLGIRYTFTDYLDDVSTTYFNNDLIKSSKGDIAAILADRRIDGLGYQGKQRGNPDNNDWYFFSGFSISYLLNNPDCFEF